MIAEATPTELAVIEGLLAAGGALVAVLIGAYLALGHQRRIQREAERLANIEQTRKTLRDVRTAMSTVPRLEYLTPEGEDIDDYLRNHNVFYQRRQDSAAAIQTTAAKLNDYILDYVADLPMELWTKRERIIEHLRLFAEVVQQPPSVSGGLLNKNDEEKRFIRLGDHINALKPLFDTLAAAISAAKLHRPTPPLNLSKLPEIERFYEMRFRDILNSSPSI